LRSSWPAAGGVGLWNLPDRLSKKLLPDTETNIRVGQTVPIETALRKLAARSIFLFVVKLPAPAGIFPGRRADENVFGRELTRNILHSLAVECHNGRVFAITCASLFNIPVSDKISRLASKCKAEQQTPRRYYGTQGLSR